MERPENLIPREEMVKILRDLAMLNAGRTTNMGILQKNNVEPMLYLYSKYGIDSAQFSKSDRYYASLPEEYERIYADVETLLESEKEEVEERKRVNDSLQTIEREAKRAAKRTKDTLP
ncbi:MAG: hypothetical protein Mars2KO_21890 [Maribacter sp.]